MHLLCSLVSRATAGRPFGQRGIRWLSTARRGGIMIASLPYSLKIEVSQ